jgi:hypothetical protein
MTMPHKIHPHDERLAALAGADPDVASDTELRAHVSACTRCTGVVDELTTLRSALAELPDLVPSRRLQLIPPVAEPRAARGGWMRRLAAPVMAAGFGLVLVGAVGTSGVLNSFSASNAGQMFQNIGENLDERSPLGAAGQESSPIDRSTDGDSFVAPGAASSDDGRQTLGSGEESSEVAPIVTDNTSRSLFSNADPRLPWLVLTGLGVGVLLAGLYLRFSAQPRAG